MPREKALAVESPATQHLRLVVRPLRVADVAIFYGERSGGIRTYLDAKTRYAAESRAFEHHLIIPGRSNATVARPGGWTQTVRSLKRQSRERIQAAARRQFDRQDPAGRGTALDVVAELRSADDRGVRVALADGSRVAARPGNTIVVPPFGNLERLAQADTGLMR